jgi:hypothetical protein
MEGIIAVDLGGQLRLLLVARAQEDPQLHDSIKSESALGSAPISK